MQFSTKMLCETYENIRCFQTETKQPNDLEGRRISDPAADERAAAVLDVPDFLSAVCLQDSVLAFWRHGMQGRSFKTNEVRLSRRISWRCESSDSEEFLSEAEEFFFS